MALEGVPHLGYGAARADPAGFALAMGQCFARFGFAIIADHGLDQALIDATFAHARALFALPERVKRGYCRQGGAGQRGYTPFGRENAKGAARADLKEFWHVGRDLPQADPRRALMADNLWPAQLPGFRDDVYGLYRSLDALGLALLGSIARYLGLEPGFFDAPTRDGDSVLRLLHYPPTPRATPAVRAGAHEDINVITLLLGAEQAGLQLLDRDGAWLDINPPPGALVVNIGDMLQRLTNAALPSTTHRVVNPAPERAHLARYSIPFFVHFAPDYVIRTLPSCVSTDRPDRFAEPITARAYLEQRLVEIGLKRAT